MNPLQTLRVALRAIFRNKLRAFLTTLGIVIGVGAVIAMMAIGAGAKAQVEAAFAAMGTNLLIIQSGSSTAGGVHGGFGSMPTLTWDDLAAIRSDVATVKAAAPSLSGHTTRPKRMFDFSKRKPIFAVIILCAGTQWVTASQCFGKNFWLSTDLPTILRFASAMILCC